MKFLQVTTAFFCGGELAWHCSCTLTDRSCYEATLSDNSHPAAGPAPTWRTGRWRKLTKAGPGQKQVHPFRADFEKIERREWWLWAVAFLVTLLLTVGLASFLLSGDKSQTAFSAARDLPQFVPALVGLVFLFDLYTIYQHLLIYRIRRQALAREELFHLISENAADMIAIVDMEGKRLFNSLSYQKILGYSPEELQASTSLEQIHPDDRERVRSAAESARLSGIGKTLEYRLRHKNGSWLNIESTSSVIRNGHGQPEKLVIVNRNITERKRAEEALRRSEAGYRSVVEDAPYGIYQASPTGKFLRVNPALKRMLGYEATEDLTQQDPANGIFQGTGQHQRFTELLLRKEETKDLEIEWTRRDGTPIIVRCSGRRIDDENGVTAYVEVFAEDVTEKRVLEKQLRMAQKMEAIGRLSGGIAHDFNNLLGVIIGYSHVLTRTLSPESELRDHALEIEKAGQRAAALTRQLLAFSRQQVMTPAILNLNTLASEMGKMLPRLLGEDVQVCLVLDPVLGSVRADQTQIEQVIMNLSVNARDAMPMGGTLKIQTSNVEFDQAYVRNHPGSTTGSYVMLAVSDTGTGINPEVLTHIFEPFYTTKELGKGTGLGLATVYGIVKQSQGYIWVDTELQKGSSFQIYLPRHVGRPEEGGQKTDAGERLSGTETILLVEDAEPLRKLAQTFLKTAGFCVLSAANSEEALQVAANTAETLHLLLTDVVMPGMNGRALAERLLTLRPEMKVLYMSGYSDSLVAGHGVLKPGTHLLHKPFTEEDLIRKVREVLDSGIAMRAATARAELATTGMPVSH